MSGLIYEITALGVSIAAFSRRANLAFQTIKRINNGDRVHPHKLAKAKQALAEIKAELEHARNRVQGS